MKPKSIVTCVPAKDLEKSQAFYKECFKLDNLIIEDGMITIELANLSMFVMSRTSYEEYIQKAGLAAGYPTDSLQVLHSCAVEDEAMIEHLFATAEQYGGIIAQPVQKNEWGQNAGYIRDPDGHLWEIVQVG